MSDRSDEDRTAREVPHLTRAVAHDVRGRSNTLALVVALLEDHADPIVKRAVEKVRRASSELVTLAVALEATGELYVQVDVPRVRVSTFVDLFTSRANTKLTSSVADSTELHTDPMALVDAVGAVLGETRELRLDADGTHATLRLPGVRPRLGSSPSLEGLRLELAAARGGGDIELDAEGTTIRIRLAD